MMERSVPKKTPISHEKLQAMDYIKRTRGDGMENVSISGVEAKPRVRLGDSFIYHPTNLKQLSSMSPVLPTGTIVNLIPKSINNVKEQKHNLCSLKPREPKFIPYEPYKAAVNPIIPREKKGREIQKSDLNINLSVSQVAALKVSTLDSEASDRRKESSRKCLDLDRSNEKKIYEAQVHKLQQENNQLENQLKFQAQVNGELKNLLVAAVGEDLETRVHLLTEDKLQLAQAVLNSTQHLNTHQEQTEWLAGQCEVWRSKFLASSLMVEDLAQWKAALSQKIVDLQEAVKKLLEERSNIRDASLKTYRTLRILRENFDPAGAASSNNHRLTSLNALDLAQGCCQLAEILKVQLLSGLSVKLHKDVNISNLETKTCAEKHAEGLITIPSTIVSGRQDAACSAVMGAAMATGGQMFLFQKNFNIACCAHCSGEVKQV